VPLSKVGFAPGRVIHTNEFHVTIDGKQEILSHKETSNYILTGVKQESTSPSNSQSYTETNSTSVKKIPSAPTSILKKTNNDSVSSTSIAKTNSAEQSNNTSSSSTNNTNSSNLRSLPVFEIREFVDENGNMLSSQVVDLSKELMESASSAASNAATSTENTERNTSTASNSMKDGELMRKEAEILETLNKKLNIPESRIHGSSHSSVGELPLDVSNGC
jgi:hypothetical protein